MSALFENLTNEELRDELEKNGVSVGPLTATTRKVYEIKLLKIVQKKDNAEEFMQNISISDRNNRAATLDLSVLSTTPAENGDALNSLVMKLRNGSPVVQNSSSLIRNGSPVAGNGSPVVQNVSSLVRNGSPMHYSGLPSLDGISNEGLKKETIKNAKERMLLLNNTSEVFVAVQDSNGGAESVNCVFPQMEVAADDHGSSSDDDANESSRILSPEEIAKFRSRFSSANNTDELISGIANNTSKASPSIFSQFNSGSKRHPASALTAQPIKKSYFSSLAHDNFVIIILFCMAAVGLCFKNWTYISDFFDGAKYKDEI